MRKIVIVLGLSLFLPVIGVGGVGGCGGGSGGETPPETPAAEAAAGQGSVTAALSAVETSLLSSVFRSGDVALTVKRQETDAGSVGLDNCTESVDESSDGFSVTCDCIVSGESSGSVTTTFASSRVDGDCLNGDGSTGSMFSMSGAVAVEFDQCAIGTCGERLTLSGSIQGVISYSLNDCTSSEALEATLGTAEECAGLTVTHEDDSTDTLGFSATNSTGGDGDTQSGTACINDETADLSDLQELCDEEAGDACSEATVACVSDFACQLFADSNTDDNFNTDNVACVEGCCVISETGRCSDGEDNDFDGQTDCDDSDCAEDPYCTIGPCGSGTVSCANDFACQTFADSDQTDAFTTSNVSCVNGCCVAAAVSEAGQCTDGEDNDSDGSADCNDSDCSGDLACRALLPCTTEQNCSALTDLATGLISQAEISCDRYDPSDWRYRFNDGSCRFDCSVTTSPMDCLESCEDLWQQLLSGGGPVSFNGAFRDNVEKICLLYPPPH